MRWRQYAYSAGRRALEVHQPGRASFSSGFATVLSARLERLADLRLSPAEKQFLITNCPYLNPLTSTFGRSSLNPGEVVISQLDEKLTVKGEGQQTSFNVTSIVEVLMLKGLAQWKCVLTNTFLNFVHLIY